MPFFIKHQAVEDARKRGICFEICYSTALKEDYTRTWFLKNSIQLVKATKGKGVILCSGASDEIYHRTPMEVKQM
jgi:ribonuclease P/MRP protein subunit RPP1